MVALQIFGFRTLVSLLCRRFAYWEVLRYTGLSVQRCSANRVEFCRKEELRQEMVSLVLLFDLDVTSLNDVPFYKELRI